MKTLIKVFGLLVSLFFFNSTVYAQEDKPFYNQKNGAWTIWGHPGNTEAYPACIMEMNSQNNQMRFQIIVMVIDSNTLITKLNFQDKSWKTQFVDEIYTGISVLKFIDGKVTTEQFEFTVKKNNTVDVVITKPQLFFDTLINLKHFDFYFNLDNSVNLTFANDIHGSIEHLINCLTEFDKKGKL